MAYGKWLRIKMLETCFLAGIEDDAEREAWTLRIGEGHGDAEYLRDCTAEIRARQASGTLYPGEAVLMTPEEQASLKVWVESWFSPPPPSGAPDLNAPG